MADNTLQFILKMRDEATAILKAHGAAVGEAAGKHNEAAGHAKKHGDALTELGNKAKEATEAIAALWSANELARASLEAFSQYEQGMIRIARTTQLAGQAVQDFQAAFDNMARETKGANVENLLEYSAIAGQLGIKGSQDILNFSQTLGKLGTVTDIVGEAGAKQFGRLLILTGEGAGGVKKLADSLAGLQADTKAAGGEILRMASQLAQTTAGFKLGTAEITGMAAAATQLNIEPFLLSNAVGRSLRALQDGTINASGGIRDLTAMLGMNREEFKKLINTHPEQALVKFLAVINALQKNGQSVTGFLQKFQLQGDESQKVLLTLAKNMDEVNAKIKESQDLQAHPGALDSQYAGFAESLKADLAELTTAWELFAKNFGKALAPAVKEMLGEFTTLLNGANALFEAMPDLGQKIAAWTAVGIPALVGINAILRIFGGSLTGIIGQVLGLGAAFTTMGAEAAASATGVAAAAGAARSPLLARGLAGTLGAYGAAAWAAHGTGEGIADLILQQRQFKKQGISWRDEALGVGAMLPSWMGGDNYKSALKGSMQREKDERAYDARRAKLNENMKGRSSAGTEPGAEKKPSEEEIKAGSFLSDKNKQALEHFDQYTKRLETFKDAQSALQALKEGSAKGTPGVGDYKTPEQIASIEKAIELEMRQLDPMNKLRDAWAENLASARAYTKEQQNQYAIEKAIAEQQRTNPRFSKKDESELRLRMSAIQEATKQKAYREEAISLNQQLATVAALTQADKDRLAVEFQIANLAKDKGFDKGQLDQLRQLLTTIKQVEERMSQFKALNSQANALRDYNTQLKLLNDNRKAMGEGEYAREKMALDQQTLAARNPVGKIAQDQADELAQMQIVGAYREADLKTLQQITQLKRDGVIADDADGRAIQAQLGANNRRLQDLKDLQEELNGLTESFGSGLSQAIGNALNGQRHAFTKFLADMGQKMMDTAFTHIAKQFEPSVNGLLGGLFGQANDGVAKLGKLAQDQMTKTTATASMTVTAATVIVNGATDQIKTLTDQAKGMGTQGPIGSGIDAATGSTGNAATSVLSQQPLTSSGVIPALAGAGTAAVGAGAAALGGAGSSISSAVGAGASAITSLGGAGVPTISAPNGIGSIAKAGSGMPSVAEGFGAYGAVNSTTPAAAGGFGTSLAPTLPGNGVGTIKPADWTSFASGGAGKGAIPSSLGSPSSYAEQLKTFGGTPTPDDWRTDFGHTGFQIQSAGMGQNKDLVAGLEQLGKGGGSGGGALSAIQGQIGQGLGGMGGAGGAQTYQIGSTASMYDLPKQFGAAGGAAGAAGGNPFANLPDIVRDKTGYITQGSRFQYMDAAHQFYRQNGFSEKESNAILSNQWSEGAFDPRALNKNDVAAGAKGTAQWGRDSHGIGQWNRDRWGGVQQQYKKDWGTADESKLTDQQMFQSQLQFTKHEVRTDPNYAAALKRADRGEISAGEFGKTYEGFAGNVWTGRDKTSAMISQRYANWKGDTAPTVSAKLEELQGVGTGKPIVIGDSIGKGYGQAIGAQTFATKGLSTDAILKQIKADPKLAQAVQGQNVVLSSGASNSPADLAKVGDQLKQLKELGAKKVDLLGVGDRADFQKLGVNDKLSEIAKQQGADFKGPLDPSILGKDRVHPNYQSLSRELDMQKKQAAMQLDKSHLDMTPTGSLGSKNVSEMSQASELAKKAQEQMTQSQKQLAESFKQQTQQTTQGFSQLGSGITGVGQDAMQAVPGVGQFGASIEQLMSKMQQGGGGMGGLGGLFGGGGGGGGFMDFGGGDFVAFHTGGLVGYGSPSMTRHVSPAVFIGAPRFHTGLGSDEFPAILQKGERVLTRDQDSRATALMSRMADQMNGKSSTAGETLNQNRGRGNAHVTMNIQTKDANSFRYSQGQIMAQAHAGISRASAKHN